MATRRRNNTTPPRNPDEKIIQAHMEIIAADYSSAATIISAANSSAEEAKQFAQEFPAVQPDASAVINKVAEMATLFDEIEKSHREAMLAAASEQKAAVAAKATEVNNYLQSLKSDDVRQKALFEVAKNAAGDKRWFKGITDEVKGIQRDVQGLLGAASAKATAAQTAADTARGSLPRLSGKAKTAAEMAQSLAPSVKEADERLRRENDTVATLTARMGEVTAALAATNDAASRNDKPSAQAALESAKEAQSLAGEAASSADDSPTGGAKETKALKREDDPEGLQTSFWVNLAILAAELVAILWFVPEWLKPFFGLAWTALTVLTCYHFWVKKTSKWDGWFWKFAGVLALCLALTFVWGPVFGGDAADTLRNTLPGGSTDPTVVPTPTPFPD